MNIEEYIKQNRNKLDVEMPDEDYLWTGISQAMNDTRKRTNIVVWRSIAAASIILVISILATYFYNNNNNQQLIFVNIDPALASQEAQFKNQIDSYAKLIEQSSFKDNQRATSDTEIHYIDELISHYSEDLKQKGPNSQLINSLMDLYRKKLMLLERMLNEIEKSKGNEKRNINI